MKKVICLFYGMFFLFSSFIRIENYQEIRQGKDYALFFAIDQYDEWQDLRYPISDATSIADELERHYGFNTQVIKNPTKAKIYQTLEFYRKKTYDSDGQLLIFFTGHGTFSETQEGFFIPKKGKLNDPYQESYIPHTRLNRIINSISCKHILLAIDACFSGTFDESIALNKSDDRPGTNQNERKGFIDRALKYKSRLFVTSGGKERTPDRSQFAKQFLTALRNFGGGDEIVDFNELVGSLIKAKPQPKSGQFSDHEIGGNFLFIVDEKNKEKENKAYLKSIQLADKKAWDRAKQINSITSLQGYIQENPNGKYVEEAFEKIIDFSTPKSTVDRENEHWLKVRELNNIEGYENFVSYYPNSKYTGTAQGIINDFYNSEFLELPKTAITIFNYDPTLKKINGSGININTNFNSKRYNNQPCFYKENNLLFSSYMKETNYGQTDIYQYTIDKAEITRLTDSKTSEYSPAINPFNGKLNYITVEADFLQRIWEQDLNINATITKVKKDKDGLGYYCRLSKDLIAVFMIGEPHYLELFNLSKNTSKVISENIGRCLKKRKNGNLLFVHKLSDVYWVLKEFDIKSSSMKTILKMQKEVEDFEIINDEHLLCGSGSKLYSLNLKSPKKWNEVFDFKEQGVSNISRLSFNGKDKLAIVVH